MRRALPVAALALLVLAATLFVPFRTVVSLAHEGGPPNVPATLRVGGRVVFDGELGCSRQVGNTTTMQIPCVVHVETHAGWLDTFELRAGNQSGSWVLFRPWQPFVVLQVWKDHLEARQSGERPGFQ